MRVDDSIVLEDWMVESVTDLVIPIDAILESLLVKYIPKDLCDILFDISNLEDIEKWCHETRKKLEPEKQFKPCPCCGSSSVFKDNLIAGDTVLHSVRCSECGLKAPMCFDTEKAMRIWNRRT